jgi:hypothetical protein
MGISASLLVSRSDVTPLVHTTQGDTRCTIPSGVCTSIHGRDPGPAAMVTGGPPLWRLVMGKTR